MRVGDHKEFILVTEYDDITAETRDVLIRIRSITAIEPASENLGVFSGMAIIRTYHKVYPTTEKYEDVLRDLGIPLKEAHHDPA